MAKNSPSSGAELRVAQGACATSSPYILPEKNCAQAKMQKHNINKIYQIELKLKEMTYLMIIAETKKTFSTFQFFY